MSVRSIEDANGVGMGDKADRSLLQGRHELCNFADQYVSSSSSPKTHPAGHPKASRHLPRLLLAAFISDIPLPKDVGFLEGADPRCNIDDVVPVGLLPVRARMLSLLRRKQRPATPS